MSNTTNKETPFDRTSDSTQQLIDALDNVVANSAAPFTHAALHKDGKPVWSELNDVTDDELMTGADAEALAAQDPDHDWRIVLHGPLAGRTYQRHGPGEWVLVEMNQGFA